MRLYGSVQYRFRVATRDCEIVGEPDFMIRRDGGYVIRDSKLTRRIAGHPEIAFQLQTYGWLYEQEVGERPLALEVHSAQFRQLHGLSMLTYSTEVLILLVAGILISLAGGRRR